MEWSDASNRTRLAVTIRSREGVPILGPPDHLIRSNLHDEETAEYSCFEVHESSNRRLVGYCQVSKCKADIQGQKAPVERQIHD